jgi:hypothetical protein
MQPQHYFYRCAVFTRKNNVIALADINQPNHTSDLEEWFGVVISLADGQHTLQELMDYMSKQYQQAPANLQDTLNSVIERLVDGKLVKLSEQKIKLPYYLASPIEQLDIEKAKQLMKEDGYTLH